MTINKKQKVLFCFLLFSVCFALFTACENPFIEKHTQKAQEVNSGGGDNVFTVGEDGYWYINGVNTGVSARGGTGETVQPGFLGGVVGITGTYRIGETLNVITDSITGAEAPFTYQWIADGVAISSAFNQTYTLRGADAGKNIGCIVSHETAHGSIVAWGKKTPFNIDLEIRGNKVASDTITLSGETGHVGDVITLTYNIADTALHNNLEFRDIDPVLAPATSAGTGTRQYTVKAADAINGVIAIIAVFTHYNNAHLDPIAFNVPGNITVTYGSNDNSYTNTIKNTYSGTGTIRYSSNNPAIAAVNSSGVVTIRKAGNVIISAEKDADVDYAYAFQSYNLIINPKPVTITGLGAADKVYDGTTWTQANGTPLVDGKLADDDVSVNRGTATFADSNVGSGKIVTFNGWSLTGTDAENYLLAAQPVSVTANITKAQGAAVSGAPTVNGTPTMVSIEIHAVSNAGTTGQTVEYAVSTSNSSVPQTGWQTTLLFNGLTGNTTYYIFARTQESTNFLAGAAQVSTGIITASSLNVLSIGDPSPLVYTNPGNFLTPIETDVYTERGASFSVTVSGFRTDEDANNVGLALTGNGLIFSGHDAVGYATGGAKTFSVTVTIDDTVTINADSVNVGIGLSGIIGYYYTEKTILIGRTDGRTTEGAIPITRSNIALFNIYATAESTSTAALTLHYKLTENIVASNLRTDLGPNNNWMPIGTGSVYPFTGSFDGQNHTITGLKLQSQWDSYIKLLGLFSRVGTGGIVKNIGLVNCNVSDVTGSQTVGGVAGVNYRGTVENCYVTGNVSGNYVGGVVGENEGTVQNCYVTGNVSNVDVYKAIDFNEGYVGGVVGNNYNTVQNCYATGNVSGSNYNEHFFRYNCVYVGSVVGYNRGTVQSCYATGNVSGYYFDFDYSDFTVVIIGGVVGYNSDPGMFFPIVRNCVALNVSIKNGTPNYVYNGRVTTGLPQSVSNNYARSDMIVQYNWDGSTGTDTLIDLIDADLNNGSGADITAAQYNNQNWWLTASNWSTNSYMGQLGFAWDFTDVWEWNAATSLPILRNMPAGAQNPTVQ